MGVLRLLKTRARSPASSLRRINTQQRTIRLTCKRNLVPEKRRNRSGPHMVWSRSSIAHLPHTCALHEQTKGGGVTLQKLFVRMIRCYLLESNSKVCPFFPLSIHLVTIFLHIFLVFLIFLFFPFFFYAGCSFSE
jgi:hypothetical protein